MFRQYRNIEKGEFFVVFADTSAGGSDYNACQFLSKTKIDIPLIYHQKGIATEMTNSIFPVIEKIFDLTGITPMVAYETNNGGIFELERLSQLNRLSKFSIYKQQTHGTTFSEQTEKIGWTTNVATRPRMLQDFKNAIDNKLVKIYDKQTIAELYSFIIGKTGKPEAESNAHDDLVMSGAGAWQLYQECEPKISKSDISRFMSELPVNDLNKRYGI
jgi:hypothetical protein